MTIFDWLEAVSDHMFSILLENMWHSALMGGTTIVVAGIALFFNHYDWKRAKILSLMTFFGLIGMNLLARTLFGSEVNTEMGLKTTAMTFLMGIFLIWGYYLAGWISALRPNPVVQLKLQLAKKLSLIALFLENSAMENKQIKTLSKEVDALTYMQTVAASKMGDANG